jgi:transcriptional regulator with XRE-family HTH domain
MNVASGPRARWQAALSALGLSTRAFARQAGVSHTYLYSIMNGRVCPSAEIKALLLSLLGASDPEAFFSPPKPVSQPDPPVVCKRCHSLRTTRSGLSNGAQRYRCRDCGCVFLDNRSPYRGRLPIHTASAVMQRFFAAETLGSLCRFVRNTERMFISLSGLESLVTRYSRLAVRLTSDIFPTLGPLWCLECTAFTSGRTLAVTDIIDLSTGFLIATDLLPPVVKNERESVIQKAYRLTGSKPTSVLFGPALLASDHLFGFNSRQYSAGAVSQPDHLALLSRFQTLAQDRTKLITRRLNYDAFEAGDLLCSAWRVHHNFLSGALPPFPGPYQSWSDILNERG